MSGKTLAAAAAAAGMSERTARQWQSGALPSTAKAPRTRRTREDPFAEAWESEVVPQLVADTDSRLQVLALFKALCRRHPGRFQEGQLRTLQRRVRDWRVQYGADREVYFEQVAVAGREAAFDFTDASDLRVTIRGVPFAHLLFEWVLSYSKWTYVGLPLERDVRGAGGGPAGRAVDAGRGAGVAPSRQLVGGDARAETQRRAPVDGAVPAGDGPLRAGLVEDPAGENRTRTGWPSRRTSARRRPSSRRCCCGATETSRTSRRIWASCVRSSTRSGTGRRRLGWPRERLSRKHVHLRADVQRGAAGELPGAARFSVRRGRRIGAQRGPAAVGERPELEHYDPAGLAPGRVDPASGDGKLRRERRDLHRGQTAAVTRALGVGARTGGDVGVGRARRGGGRRRSGLRGDAQPRGVGPGDGGLQTRDGSAQAGEEASGTLTLAAGDSSKTIEVGVLDDAHDEGEETFHAGAVERIGAVAGGRRGDRDDREQGPDADGAAGAVRAGDGRAGSRARRGVRDAEGEVPLAQVLRLTRHAPSRRRPRCVGPTRGRR